MAHKKKQGNKFWHKNKSNSVKRMKIISKNHEIIKELR
jgi:hypothetical protein